jgi:hypothetical protein
MCCDSMVCASCSRPVAQGACPVCRGARAQLHGQPISFTALVLALAALLTLAVVLAARI